MADHREMMASVAHDLRTPLTALHGHVEALGRGDLPADDPLRRRHAAAAVAQSNKVRRLSQQLFELATLQSTDQVLQHERFRIDELVADAVQKFELSATPPPVALDGPPPGSIECDGDLQLIERALTNLIDNAVRHAPHSLPVRVRLQCDAQQVQVLVEDGGPGLPRALAQRLDQGQPVRDPPLARPGGGVGGLGLAIAQRIAWLHGGSLRTLPAPTGGTRLCLALPRQRLP
jgi:K+-sensing histidine kinase KdpD